MKAITGEAYKTSLGMAVVYNEQETEITSGEVVLLNGSPVKVKHLVAPSKPGGKWSFMAEE